MQVYSEHVSRGGGGMNCITQQQPASAAYAERCGWAKVKVDVGTAVLYARPDGDLQLGHVSRLSDRNGDIYLQRLSSSHGRVLVRVEGPSSLDGWIDGDAIESAGEKCPHVSSLNE